MKEADSYRLRNGKSTKTIVEIFPDPGTGLYRIIWPDIGPSDLANLTRCKAAVMDWAESRAMTEDRKKSGARRLKSLENFSWSASYVCQKQEKVACAHLGELADPAVEESVVTL
jgi:hypothetical protein